MSGTRRDFLCQVAGAGGYRATYLTMQSMGLLGTTAASEPLALAVGSDVKGKLSLAIYVVSVPLAFVNPWISISLYVVVAAMWLVPDRRIETRTK